MISIPVLPAAQSFLRLFDAFLNKRDELHRASLMRFPQENVHVLARTTPVCPRLTMSKERLHYIHSLLLYSKSHFR